MTTATREPRVEPIDIALVSGIWPPDIGGPASHGPEFGSFLVRRGHRLRAVTSGSGPVPEDPGFPVAVSRRDRPRAVRIPAGAATVALNTRGVDVIYATGMYGRSSLAARINRTPLVFKMVSDPAYERARRLGLFAGTLEDFQSAEGHSIATLKRVRNAIVSRAKSLVIPSEYLARIVAEWDLPRMTITVIPNPAPAAASLPTAPREELRRRLGIDSPTLVFAGRIVQQKNLPLAIAALREVAGVSLIVIGDGPERGALEQAIAAARVTDRVRLLGALPRAEVLAWLAAADAAVLPSDWENFPHAAVEALAVGTPVLATSVGGVPEIVESGVNGIVFAAGDHMALAAAISTAIIDESARGELRRGAGQSNPRFEREAVFEGIERELLLAAT